MEYFNHLPEQFKTAILTVGIITGSLLLGSVIKLLIFGLIKSYRREKAPLLTTSVVKHLSQPSSWFIPLLVLSFMLPLIKLPPGPSEVLRRILELSLIITFAWCLVEAINVLQDLIRNHYQISKADNYRERRLLTQLQFVRKVAKVSVLFFAVCLILMSFATVRKIGTGLITSAGIASVIVGFAAQRSISNLLAGFQIAFTQPIRIDDVLVVEGEWGRVEEITLTYVVLRIWDERRLVLPLNYFIEKPFQNWTRTTSQLLGTVFLYTDYTVPIEAVREELTRIVSGHKLWDKRVCLLQVTESKESTLELRILVSAADSGSAFDLRCDVREKLITFIQENYPESLPKIRSEITGSSIPEKMGDGVAALRA